MKKLIIICVLFISTLINAEDLKLIVEKSFNVNSGEKLYLKGEGGGDVEVTAWDKNEVEVKIYGNSKAERKIDFKVEKKEKEVYVKGEKKGSDFFFSFSNINIKYKVMVPKEYVIEVGTSGGDVIINDVTGLKKVSTSGGDITIKNSKGELKCSTSGGDIEVENFDGDIDLGTSGGDIKLKTKNCKVIASTSGGDITVEYNGENKGIDLSTSGGDIKLSVEKDIKADLMLKTSGGEISVSLPLSSTEKVTSSKFIGKTNGGGNLISATTSGGDIGITQIK